MEKTSWKKYRSIYYPMLMSIGVIVLVVALIYAFIFHWVTLEKNRTVFERELQSSLDETTLSMQNAMTLLQQVACDGTAYRLIDYPKLSPTELMRAHAQLKRYMNVDPSIVSIYLYKASAQTVFVGGNLYRQSEYTLDTLPDPGFAACLARDQIRFGVEPVLRMVMADNPQYTPKSQEVFTLMYTLLPAGNFAQHDTVAIQFRSDALVSLPGSASLGSLLVYASDTGEMKYASCTPELGVQLAQTAAEITLDMGAGETFFRRLAVQSKDYYLFVKKDALFGWTALMAVPYSVIDRDSFRVVWVSMGICAGFALLACFLSWRTSRRIYRKTGLEEMRRIEEQNQRQRYLLQRQVIRNVVDGRHSYEKEELEELLAGQKITLKADGTTWALLLRVDEWQRFSAAFGNNGVEEIFRRLLEEGKKLDGETTGTFLTQGKLFLLYQPSSEKTDESELLLELGREIQQFVREKYQTTLSGMVGERPRRLYHWCSEASVLEEMQYVDRLFHGYGRLLIQPDVRPGENQYPKQQERALLNSLKMGDFEQARKNYDQFVEEISHDRLHYINLALVHLCLMLDENIALIAQNNHLPAGPHDFDILIDFETVERMEEIDRQFYRVFDRLESAMLSRRANRQQEMAEQIEQYIQAHYDDVDLSRQQVCDALSISYAAAGVAFKKAYDTSIAVYIMQLRLQKACEFLQTTSDTLETVAAKCGFSSLGYFYKMFKREYGVTPGEYRKIQAELFS